jgi:hypothetical protein
LLGDPVATGAQSPFLQAAALDELVTGGVQIETTTNDMVGAFGRAWDDVAKETATLASTGVLNSLEEFAPQAGIGIAVNLGALEQEGGTRGRVAAASEFMCSTDWSSNTR